MQRPGARSFFRVISTGEIATVAGIVERGGRLPVGARPVMSKPRCSW
jgi:hypothetical protein